MSESLVRCACCNKYVIRINRSKRRTCSHKCFMKLWRADRKAAALALLEATASGAETPEQP